LNQRGGIVQALVFSLGIIVLFCALGLGVTALAGPIGISQLGGNPWVNAFIAAVFCVFALSLLGAFEITLPSGLLTKLDGASRRGGYFGTLLMGLTFSLTSFACVGPFVGPLLASSVQAQGAQPVIGMAAFATGLASPFFFLAAFPSYLKKLPRSGGWLARVKIVMGFVLLAVMLKYLSTIDQVLATNLLTRERFLAAWFVLFAMAGLYLLGLLRLEGIEADDKLSTGRLLSGSAILIFAFSLLPGMFGAPLGELDAYVPVATGGITGNSTTAGGLQWMKNDYQAALDRGRQENKLVLVTFTGYACTNCHWMKANMFTRPEIAGVMKDFNAGTLHREIEPFMLWINNKKDGLWGSLTVHSSTKSYRELLSRIESVWKKDIPGVPFEYAFLDEQVQKMYESDQTMTRIINAFTGIAILISCLGLFGLAAFSAEQRHKEIGIRKVLGASVPGVIVLLSGDFLKLVGIAFLIATPLSWWAMNRWLMDFAYHIPLSWWMFGLGGLTTTFIALATVSSQAFCAATVNPVRTLRSE